jgi:hypothetical protein
MSENYYSKMDLIEFIETKAGELDLTAQDSSNNAFNLGCWVGLFPLMIIVTISFFITNRSWIAAVIIGALMSMALAAFANLIANISLNNAVERHYNEKVLPEIETKLDEIDLTRKDFNFIADEVLPAGSMLRRYIQEEMTE